MTHPGVFRRRLRCYEVLHLSEHSESLQDLGGMLVRAEVDFRRAMQSAVFMGSWVRPWFLNPLRDWIIKKHHKVSPTLPDLVLLLNDMFSEFLKDKIQHKKMKIAIMDVIVMTICTRTAQLESRKIIPPTVCRDAHAQGTLGM